ncbi:MAG: DnaD domain protein [Clostridia bacterium]|nr:DnaD domain protein [Clostridia bacterium]
MKEIYINNNNNYKKKDIIEFIINNYDRSICSHELNKIDDWLKDHSEESIIKAISISIENNVKKFSYISAILNNWKKEDGVKNFNKNILSKEDVEILNYDWLNDPENWFNWDKKEY